MTQVSKHFKLAEFTRSQTAARMGRAVVIHPGSEEACNLERLCYLALEPARAYIGRPLMITSGYRPLWLNEAIGGASNSDHMMARAADFVPVGMGAERAFYRLKDSPIPFKQLILEYGQWIHLSVPRPLEKAKRECLLTGRVNGKTVYSKA